MNKYTVGKANKPPVYTVEASTIREAIIAAAEKVGAGIMDKTICREDFAFVTFVKGDKTSNVVIALV